MYRETLRGWLALGLPVLFATGLVASAIVNAPQARTFTVPLHGTGFDAGGNPLASGPAFGGVDGSWTSNSPLGTSAFGIAPGNADWYSDYAPNTGRASLKAQAGSAITRPAITTAPRPTRFP